MLVAIATYDTTLGVFMRYAQSIGALVDESELFDGHQINFLRVIVYWIPPSVTPTLVNRVIPSLPIGI